VAETDLCQYWPRWFREILDRLALRPPFTLTFLYKRLDGLFGPNNWTVEVDYPDYTLYIEADLSNQLYFRELSVTMGIIKPCHIVYVNRLRVETPILLSEQVERYKPQYNYILGSWELGRLPFMTILEKETVKMPEQTSIRPELLEQTAGFVAEDVKAVHINGSLTITALSRYTVGNAASVSYRVLREQTAEVTRIELLDGAGEVLTECTVSVPVLEEAVALRHIFAVKEGV